MTYLHALAVGWTLLMLAAVALPGGNLPSTSLPHLDKLVHFGLFACYGVLWMTALRSALPAKTRLVLASGLAYALTLEIVQLLPFLNRSPDVNDALCNVLGLLVAVACYHSWHKYSR